MSEYETLRDTVDRARSTLGSSESRLRELVAKGNQLTAEHDAADTNLGTAREARAQKPSEYTRRAATEARDRVETLDDQVELNARAVEQAQSAVESARTNLAAVEREFAPVKAKHNVAVQVAHDTKRKAYDAALPHVRQLVALFGTDTSTAVTAILNANCVNPLPDKAPQWDQQNGSIFAQMAACAAR